MKTVRTHGSPQTGHKTFDRQTGGYVSTGNVWGDAQFSNFIRAYCETECNGAIRPVGHLQAFDLKPFTDLPNGIRRQVEELTKDEQGILYEFRHWVGPSYERRKVIHGWILTRNDTRGYRFVKRWVIGPTHRSYAIMDAVQEYVSHIQGTTNIEELQKA
jgi:hypothetical protein